MFQKVKERSSPWVKCMHVIFSFEQKLSLDAGREEDNLIVVGRDEVFVVVVVKWG